MSTQEEELNIAERLILANQCKILEKLYPSDAEYYSASREALERGFTLEYPSVFGAISERQLSRDHCRWVMNVLDMFASLQNAYSEFNDASDIDPAKLQFRGFSANDESDLLGYVLYLRRTGRWSDVLGNGDLNSHAPSSERYNRMLEKWKASVDRDMLTKDDIVRIIA